MTHWEGNLIEVAPGPAYVTGTLYIYKLYMLKLLINFTENDLIPWIRANAGTACHYYGGAPMGTGLLYNPLYLLQKYLRFPDVSSSVTNPRMKVHGVNNLRIVGPSVIPAPIFPGMQLMGK